LIDSNQEKQRVSALRLKPFVVFSLHKNGIKYDYLCSKTQAIQNGKLFEP
jgi:hypothetical protein